MSSSHTSSTKFNSVCSASPSASLHCRMEGVESPSVVVKSEANLGEINDQHMSRILSLLHKYSELQKLDKIKITANLEKVYCLINLYCTR